MPVFRVNNSTESKNISLLESNFYAAVLRNVSLILAIPQGSIPFYRDFGVSWDSFVDRPVPVAKTMIFAKIREAVQLFEPRAEIVSVDFQPVPNDTGHFFITAEVNISDEQESGI